MACTKYGGGGCASRQGFRSRLLHTAGAVRNKIAARQHICQTNHSKPIGTKPTVATRHNGRCEIGWCRWQRAKPGCGI
ncbi:MAG: hypothetical protein G01um101431_12 [Parcubacteria group bacterium Gr01-1014_31]|nr:MAG: hypothetical protein G01um101431_12 [Parcubacteria group bacterium Gr01-1014_31]